jgi:class 3 adenylate cyclase
LTVPLPDRHGLTPSPELVAVVTRWMRAREHGDARPLANLFSNSEHLRYIGTDPDELFAGRLLREGYAAHVAEIPPFRAECDRVEAFERGPVGWASWVGRLVMQGRDEPLPIRFSWVLTLDGGDWRIVHVHVSNPRANVETIGRRHFALQALADGARELGFAEEEGTATVMFTDIANSTAIAARMGDSAWARCVGRHLEQTGEIIRANHGRMVKETGDGTMSTFRSARRAVSAACAILEIGARAECDPRLLVRAGLHSGDVVSARGDFFGTVVNKAARLAALAEPGGALVSATTREMVEGCSDFSFEGPVSLALPGLEGAQSISRLVGPS